MELQRPWKILIGRWWIIILPVFVVFILLLITGSLTSETGTTYTVGMRLAAAPPADISMSELESAFSYEDRQYVPWLASEYVVVNLPHWVTSDSFAREVSGILNERGIEKSAEDIRPMFAADAARSILVVYVNGDDEAETQAVAEAAVTVLQTRNQIYFPQFAAYPAEVIPLDDVRVTAAAPSLMTRFSPFLRLGIALAAGIGLATLAEYFDESIYETSDIQDMGLTILGVIPRR